MDIRDSFSRLKKKVKHLGNKHKPDRTGAAAGGENADPANPPPRPMSHTATDNGRGNEARTDGHQAHSTDQPPHQDEQGPVPAGSSENGPGEGGVGVDGEEVGQMDLHPHSDVEVGAGSESGRDEGVADGGQYGQFDPASTPCNREPNGT